MSDKNQDIFISNKIYPDIVGIFKSEVKPLITIKDNCIVVFDTNVLLLPYIIGKASLEEIKKIYSRLASEKRLVIPGQVAREFAKNRPVKLCEIHKQLLDKKSKINNMQDDKYPFLEGFEEYKKMLDLEKQMDVLLKDYKATIDLIVDNIKSWNWNDPVSQVYKEVFTDECLVDKIFPEDELIKELEHRKLNSVPPGYKDTSKKDNGIGDLLIWKTILEVGKEHKKDIIFVSGDIKADWWYSSNNQNLYPRYELVDEFRRYSEGMTLHIIEFSTLLNLYEVPEEIIKEVKNEEVKNKTHNELFISNKKKFLNYNIKLNKIKYPDHNEVQIQQNSIINEMVEWFHENYIDPANGVPYDGREGGYQYFNGGPYNQDSVLSAKFPEYDEVLIAKAVEKINTEGYEWVKIGQY